MVGNVCKECGLVVDTLYIEPLIWHGYIPKKIDSDDIGKGIFRGPLSPDFEYYQNYPKHSLDENLDRALRIQKRKKTKPDYYYYFRALKNIERICSSLILPNHVYEESLNIAKSIIKEKNTFFEYRIIGDYRLLAAVKIGCQIHDFWVDNKDFVKNSRDYDYKPINLRNNQIKRAIDKEMMEIKRILKLHVGYPNHPVFINIACSVYKIPQEKITKTYILYDRIKNFLNQTYKIEGYILAMIYLNFNKDYNITLSGIEKDFCVARDTIRKRSRELIDLVYKGMKNEA